MTTRIRKRRGKYKAVTFQLTPSEALAACAELVDLTSEVASWRDNMTGTGFENSERFSIVSEAADALEEHHQNIIDAVEDLENDVPSEIMTSSTLVQEEAKDEEGEPILDEEGNQVMKDAHVGALNVVQMVVRRRTQYASRATRLSNACGSITEGVEFLRTWLEEAQGVLDGPPGDDDDEEEEESGPDLDAIEDTIQNIEESVSALEGISIPGMYG